MSDRWHRYSRKVTSDRRWPALRMRARDRDGWQCVKCGSRNRLEVDHIEPVRKRPDLAFVLSNLQTLCASCHTKKTRIELGFKPLSPARKAWKQLVRKPVPKSTQAERIEDA